MFDWGYTREFQNFTVIDYAHADVLTSWVKESGDEYNVNIVITR